MFAVVVVCTAVSTAEAQSTREEWLALRERKQARQAVGSPATVNGVLNVVSIRFYSDSAGRLVGVGEARNQSTFALSYARLDFAFYGPGGGLVGSELTYVHGGRNARILTHNQYDNVLEPGATGFFKVWTTVPASSMSSYTVLTAGENHPTVAPLAPVHFPAPPSIEGQRYSGSVLNEDPLGPGPSGLEPVLAYFVRVSVAAFQDGVITDVQSTFVDGSSFVTPCGESTATAISLHGRASFAGGLERPANSIGHRAIEWEELGVSQSSFALVDGADRAHTFTVLRRCGWTAVPDVPWISVIEGAASDQNAGTVRFTVRANTTGRSRSGRINVSGMIVEVLQLPPCRYSVSPSTVFLGPGLVTSTAGRVNVSATCSWTASSSAPWLRVTQSHVSGSEDGTLAFSVLQPNLAGMTRSAIVSVGTSSVTVFQSAGNVSADFNGDGRLDLLWHHQTDGRVGAWLMEGSRLIDGLLLTPDQVADTNWEPVATGDVGRDGTTDIVWQHAADGRLAFWRMSGTIMREGALMSPPQVADTDWKIRAMSDFNQDGDADLVWQHDGDGRIAIWFMRHATSTPTQLRGEPLGPGQVPDLGWKIVGSGDFDRDGRPDLVWQHQGDGRIAVWKMQGTTLVSGDLISPGQIADLDWKIRAVGDINGDDKADLIWQHRISGNVAAWLMDGTTLTSGISLGQVPDTNWHIVGPR